MPAPQHSKVCNRCGQAQPLSNFSKGKGTCKPCRALLVMVASQAVPGPPPNWTNRKRHFRPVPNANRTEDE
jgi:hypothetical protein